jgi:uncharacterized protein involved in type VI secretion and phage assembly
MNELTDQIHEILEQWGITHRFTFEHAEEAHTILIALSQPDIESISCNPKDNSFVITYKDSPGFDGYQ